LYLPIQYYIGYLDELSMGEQKLPLEII